VNFTKLKKGALPAVLGGGSAVVVSLGEDEVRLIDATNRTDLTAQTLAIAGTFTVVPLQHSISLLSTTLHPAEEDVESYPVFAPTCHPVPVITPGINPEQLACSPALEDVKLPKGFLRDASRAIFLLQENRTGIEGLTGDVVPGFNHIWAREVGAWGLVGVHPVSLVLHPCLTIGHGQLYSSIRARHATLVE
jgi:polynucleotide 5'-hydroxyl-kinase GRC3/NOL9